MNFAHYQISMPLTRQQTRAKKDVMLRLRGLMQQYPLPWDEFLDIFPELTHAATTPQDPTYHAEGDVWTHTQMVVESLLRLTEYQQLPEEAQFTVFYAALLHDIAKFATTRIDYSTGRVQHPHHSAKGSVMARERLWRLQVPFAIREAICALIQVHQAPFHLFRSASVDALWKTRVLSWSVSIQLLCLLAEADIRGRKMLVAHDTVLQDIALLRLQAQEEGCYTVERSVVDGHTRMKVARSQQGHPDFPMYAEPGAHVIVLSGLPASGKSTWVQHHAKNLPEVSFDETRLRYGLRYGENEGKVIHATIDQVKAHLREKTSFIWNATHLSLNIRNKSLELLYRYHAQVRLVYLEVPYTTLLERNQARDSSINQKRLESLFAKWELPLPAEVQQIEYWV